MGIAVKIIQSSDTSAWDAYVNVHPKANLYHLSGWKNVIKNAYGHKAYYLIALRSSQLTAHSSRFETGVSEIESTSPSSILAFKPLAECVTGILPLIHLKHFLFGKRLISIPFFDFGGILADNEEAEKALLFKAIHLSGTLKTKNIELRQTEALLPIRKSQQRETESLRGKVTLSELSAMNCVLQTYTGKVRMMLDLPKSAEELMKIFRSKLRNKIKIPLKRGLFPKIGGIELLDDFYKVFSMNMRDLGSPVHSRNLLANVLKEFPERAKIVLVYKEKKPLAGSIIIGFRDVLENPWASFVRKYRSLHANMLLYWAMLEYGCENGYKSFDFGRSTPGEGTYTFKKQWGAKSTPLYWSTISSNGNIIEEELNIKSKFDKAIQCWKKMPVPITKIIGPRIRKHISL